MGKPGILSQPGRILPIGEFADYLPAVEVRTGSAMKVAVLREWCDGETRVALTPASVARLGKDRVEVVVESGAGRAAGFTDEAYVAAGATLAASADEALSDRKSVV